MGNEKTPSHAVVKPVKSLHERDAIQSRGNQMQGYKERSKCAAASTNCSWAQSGTEIISRVKAKAGHVDGV